jgi:DNA repair exonuclease SbcCD nuclease subunit
MPISFLHAADIHLDSPLKGLERYESAPVDRIRGATRRAFSRMIDLAIEKRVHFVLIAGDLYDGDWRDYNTGLFLVKELGRLRDHKIRVVLIQGNHDAANKMTRALLLPDNARLLSPDRAETVFWDDLGVAIHGQSFAKAAVLENLATAYPVPQSGCLNIGLLHTCLEGADGHEPYAPCTLEDLKHHGYDYWALGHIHTGRILCDEPLVAFSGNVQGRHARETGPKGCMIVNVAPSGRIEHDFHRLDVVRWERLRIDVSEVDTESILFDRAAESLDNLLASDSDPERLLAVRLVLAGATHLHDRLLADSERVVAELRSLAAIRNQDRLWIEKVELQTQPRQSITTHDGPIQELLDVLEQFRAEAGSFKEVIEELAELKRKLPSELARDCEDLRLDDPEWLRTLLGEVQPLLFNLLHKSGNGAPSDAASSSSSSRGHLAP